MIFCAIGGTLIKAGHAWSEPSLASGWIAFGDLRGALEPCGCDPTTDLGGIKRILTAIGREKIRMPNLTVFNLGNSLDVAQDAGVKNRFIMEGLARLKPSATLLNRAEMEKLDWLENLGTRNQYLLADQRFILSNLKRTKDVRWVLSNVEDKHYIVYGYAYDDRIAQYVEPVSSQLIARLKRLVSSKKGSKVSVLLFSGPDQHLQSLLGARIFDVVVSSHTALREAIPSTRDKEDESHLVRLAALAGQSSEVWMVPLAGQGLLRGGALLNQDATSLGQLFSGSELTKAPVSSLPHDPIKQAFVPPKRITWLLPSVGESQEAKDFYDAYMQEAKKSFAEQSARRLKDLGSSPYAGAAACQSCHPQAFAKFSSSRHALALETLSAKGKAQDSECVACHVVGASLKGGFVSAKESPHLAGVQCENCHGPRKAHIQNPMSHPADRPSVQKLCLECHNSQHSPKFEQGLYWSKISHGPEGGVNPAEKSGL